MYLFENLPATETGMFVVLNESNVSLAQVKIFTSAVTNLAHLENL